MASGQIVGRDASVTVEDSAGTARNVSGDLNETTVEYSAEVPESTAYGDTFKTRSASGIRDFGVSFRGWFNDTASTGVETVLSGILGGNTVIVVGPAGSTSGNVKITACTILESYSIGVPLADMIPVDFRMVHRAGSPTRGTY